MVVQRARSSVCVGDVAAEYLLAVAQGMVKRRCAGKRSCDARQLETAWTLYIWATYEMCGETRVLPSALAGAYIEPRPERLFEPLPRSWRKRFLIAVAAELASDMPHAH